MVAAYKVVATDTGKCCGDTCISADLACCETDPDPGWCNDPTGVCESCPAGQTCYAQDINTGERDVVSWTCCESNICSFIVSTGTLVSTISATSSQSPAAPTSSSISVSSSATATPSSPANPPPASIVTYSIQTTSTLPAFWTSTTSAFTPSAPASTSSIPPWNGTGPLLVGYCATPDFSLVYGPQTTAVYLIGVVGCVGDKTDCCPFQVSTRDKMHAHDVHAYEMHANEVHAHNVHAREVHAMRCTPVRSRL
jgi:hypothetical protein